MSDPGELSANDRIRAALSLELDQAAIDQIRATGNRLVTMEDANGVGQEVMFVGDPDSLEDSSPVSPDPAKIKKDPPPPPPRRLRPKWLDDPFDPF